MDILKVVCSSTESEGGRAYLFNAAKCPETKKGERKMKKKRMFFVAAWAIVLCFVFAMASAERKSASLGDWFSRNGIDLIALPEELGEYEKANDSVHSLWLYDHNEEWLKIPAQEAVLTFVSGDEELRDALYIGESEYWNEEDPEHPLTGAIICAKKDIVPGRASFHIHATSESYEAEANFSLLVTSYEGPYVKSSEPVVIEVPAEKKISLVDKARRTITGSGSANGNCILYDDEGKGHGSYDPYEGDAFSANHDSSGWLWCFHRTGNYRAEFEWYISDNLKAEVPMTIQVGEAAVQEERPNAKGKEEGRFSNYRLSYFEDTPVYLPGGEGLHYDQNGMGQYLPLDGDEKLTALTVEYLSGPESLRDVLDSKKNGWDPYMSLCINGENLTEAGDVTYRIYGETETKWAEDELTIHVRPYEKNPVVTRADFYTANLDKPIDMFRMVERLYVSPTGSYGGAYPLKNGKFDYNNIKTDAYEVEDGNITIRQPGTYTFWTQMDVALNASVYLPVTIVTEDVPYFLRSKTTSVLPGNSAAIELIRVSDAGKAAEIRWSCEGEDAAIDENGTLTLGPKASGTIVVRTEADGLPAAELSLRAAGYEGDKTRIDFSDETKHYLSELSAFTVYNAPAGWQSFGYYGVPVHLAGGEKVTNLTIEAIVGDTNDVTVYGKEALLFWYNNIAAFGGDVTYLIVAESAKHYAQEVVSIHYGGTPAGLVIPDAPPESVIIPTNKTLTAADVLGEIKRPMDARIGVYSAKEKGIVSERAKAASKTGPEAFTIVNGIFTPMSSGKYNGAVMYTCGNLYYSDLPAFSIVVSDALKKEDFALTLEADHAEAAAGQKITLTPVFANPDLVNKKAKNDDLWINLTVNGESADDYCSVKGNVITVNKEIPGAAELLIQAGSSYCPSDASRAELRIPLTPVATAITASLPGDTLYAAEGYDTAKIEAAAEPADAIQAFSYTSSAPKIVSVDEDGTLHALSSGKATITVKATDGSGKNTKLSINAVVPVTGLILTAKSNVVTPGKSLAIKVETEPAKPTDKTVEWSFECAEEMQEFVTLKSGNLTVKKGCPAGTITVRACAAGALPDTEVKAELSVTVE